MFDSKHWSKCERCHTIRLLRSRPFERQSDSNCVVPMKKRCRNPSRGATAIFCSSSNAPKQCKRNFRRIQKTRKRTEYKRPERAYLALNFET